MIHLKEERNEKLRKILDKVGLIDGEAEEMMDNLWIIREEKQETISQESIEYYVKNDIDPDDILWARLLIIADRIKEPVLHLFKEILFVYHSKHAEAFHEILAYVEYAKISLNYSDSKAIQYGVQMNKDYVLDMANNCEKHQGNEIWCSMLKSRKPGCRWFDGEDCPCCDDTNVIFEVTCQVEFLYGMEHDYLSKKINNEINARIGMNKDSDELALAIEHVTHKYSHKILSEIDMVRDTIDEEEWKRIHGKINSLTLDNEKHICEL